MRGHITTQGDALMARTASMDKWGTLYGIKRRRVLLFWWEQDPSYRARIHQAVLRVNVGIYDRPAGITFRAWLWDRLKRKVRWPR